MEFGVLCWFSGAHLIAGVRHGKACFMTWCNHVAQEREILGHSFIVGLSLTFGEMQVVPFFVASDDGNKCS